MIDYQRKAELFKALAHPTRLKILDAIREGEVCVRSLEELTGASQSCVSQHLSLLRELELVRCRRQGNQICYTLDHAMTEYILNYIHDEFAVQVTSSNSQEGGKQ